MCNSCHWQVALENMMQLRAFKLAKIDRWVSEHRHITEPMWRAIIRVAYLRNMDIEIPAQVRKDLGIEVVQRVPDDDK